MVKTKDKNKDKLLLFISYKRATKKTFTRTYSPRGSGNYETVGGVGLALANARFVC